MHDLDSQELEEPGDTTTVIVERYGPYTLEAEILLDGFTDDGFAQTTTTLSLNSRRPTVAPRNFFADNEEIKNDARRFSLQSSLVASPPDVIRGETDISLEEFDDVSPSPSADYNLSFDDLVTLDVSASEGGCSIGRALDTTVVVLGGDAGGSFSYEQVPGERTITGSDVRSTTLSVTSGGIRSALYDSQGNVVLGDPSRESNDAGDTVVTDGLDLRDNSYWVETGQRGTFTPPLYFWIEGGAEQPNTGVNLPQNVTSETSLGVNIEGGIPESACPTAQIPYGLQLFNSHPCKSINVEVDISNNITNTRISETVTLDGALYGASQERYDLDFEIPSGSIQGVRDAIDISISSNADRDSSFDLLEQLEVREPGELVSRGFEAPDEVCLGEEYEVVVSGRNVGDCAVGATARVIDGASGDVKELGPEGVEPGSTVDFTFPLQMFAGARGLGSVPVQIQLEYNSQGERITVIDTETEVGLLTPNANIVG